MWNVAALLADCHFILLFSRKVTVNSICIMMNTQEKCKNDNLSNQKNPNNDAYWRSRGYSSRPNNWQGKMCTVLLIASNSVVTSSFPARESIKFPYLICTYLHMYIHTYVGIDIFQYLQKKWKFYNKINKFVSIISKRVLHNLYLFIVPTYDMIQSAYTTVHFYQYLIIFMWSRSLILIYI